MKASLTRVLLFAICFTASFTVCAQQYEKSLWLIWQQSHPQSKAHIDHSDWQRIINKYLDKEHHGLRRVHYDKVTGKDFNCLRNYLKRMSTIKISQYNRAEQLAFWLNVYNAIALKLVAQNYPLDSIQDINISPGLFSSGPWEANEITVEGSPISLYDIRHRIIRPIWNDPRTLYAMHNTCLGSANLFHQAFDGIRINEQLSQAAYEFINSKRGVSVIHKKLVLSRLFEWYEQDFGGSDQSVINHLKQFAKPELKKQLQSIKTITEYTYNWHLDKTSQ